MAETKKKVQLKVGDVFEIRLSDGTYAYGQYYVQDKGGDVGRFFSYRGKEKISPEEVVKYPLLFPPVHVGIRASLNDGVWVVVGNVPITDFEEPMFRSEFSLTPGKFGKWYITQGDKVEEVGYVLPEKYKKLERKGVWPGDWVDERIENGGKIPERLKWMGQS